MNVVVEASLKPRNYGTVRDFSRGMWILPLVWTIHEAEEWDILSWYQRYWFNPPVADHKTIWLGLGIVALVGWLWTAVGRAVGNKELMAVLVLPFFAGIACGNALQHIYFVFEFRDYAPGVISAVCLVIPSTVYFTRLAIRQRLVSVWYGVLIYLPCLPLLLGVIATRNRVPGTVHLAVRALSQLKHFLFGG